MKHEDIDHTGITGVGGMTNPMTTQGDVIYGGASGAPTRLPKGTAAQVLTMNAGATAPEWAAAAGGGGGLTQAYEGKNAIGASTETLTLDRVYLKKITIAEARLITNVEAYLQQVTAANASQPEFYLYDDVAGKPVHLLQAVGPFRSINPYRVAATPGDARWFGMPMGRWCAAGSYWIGLKITVQAQLKLAYDTGGSDYRWDAGGNNFTSDAPDTSGTVYTLVDTTRDYSIRANTIR
jgi:hypothetical protein